MIKHTHENLTEALTKNVTEMLSSYLEPEDELDNKINMNIWVINDDKRICIPCRDFASCKYRPENLNRCYRPEFGTLKIRPFSDRTKKAISRT